MTTHLLFLKIWIAFSRISTPICRFILGIVYKEASIRKVANSSLTSWTALVPRYSSLNLSHLTGFILYFASGGAGIVLSHVSVKLFLLSLVIGGSSTLDLTLKLIEEDQEHMGSFIPICPLDNFDVHASGHVSDDIMNIWCAIKSLRAWMAFIGEVVWTSDLIAPGFKTIWAIHIKCKFLCVDFTDFVFHLSSKVSLRVSLRNGNLSVEYSRQDPLAILPHDIPQIFTHTELQLSQDTLKSSCDAHGEWERMNPALVLAYCLQFSYQTNFTSSTVDRMVSKLTSFEHVHFGVNSLNESSAVVKFERFNCFGVVRSLYGDVDEWYPPAKRNPKSRKSSQTSNNDDVHAIDAANPTPIPMARDVISFHYISQKESELLYNIISNNTMLKSWQELKEIWPKPGSSDVGPYARARFRDDQEVVRLFEFLTTYISLTKCWRRL